MVRPDVPLNEDLLLARKRIADGALMGNESGQLFAKTIATVIGQLVVDGTDAVNIYVIQPLEGQIYSITSHNYVNGRYVRAATVNEFSPDTMLHFAVQYIIEGRQVVSVFDEPTLEKMIEANDISRTPLTLKQVSDSFVEIMQEGKRVATVRTLTPAEQMQISERIGQVRALTSVSLPQTSSRTAS